MSAVDPKQAGMAHRGEGDDLAPEQIKKNKNG